MIGLSFFEKMNRNGLLLGLIVILISMIIFTSYKKILLDNVNCVCKEIYKCSLVNYVMMIGLLLFFVYVVCHNALFFDSTWDAHVYGMPRIELFAQKQTLFVNMKSEVSNIFCNEWNGELNCIFYRIITGTNQGVFLANAENMFYSFFVVYWFCKKIGLNKLGRVISLLYYCGMPVIVLLAMTLKGDFVAIPFFVSSVMWLKDYIFTKRNHALFFLILALGLAAGSKITMVPFAGLCAISVLVCLMVDNRRYWIEQIVKNGRALLIGILSVLISCFRYILNFVYYGNFFLRTKNEKVDLSFEHLTTSVKQLVKTVFWCDNAFTHTGTVWALNQDMGIIGMLFVFLLVPILAVWIIKCSKNTPPKYATYYFLRWSAVYS
jgi:hypothetical protein